MTLRPDAPPNLIYFIRPIGMIGPVKIGCSQCPPDRLRTFQRWSPFPLEIVHTMLGSPKLEANIHSCLARFHIHHEWFDPSPEVVGLVTKLINGVPLERAIDLSKRTGTIRIPSKSGRGGRRYKPFARLNASEAA